MPDRSHALRGSASPDALRPLLGRGASLAAFPRGAWERSANLRMGPKPWVYGKLRHHKCRFRVPEPLPGRAAE
ncbi:hypothetical protein AWU82_29655 [Pseudomonas glycinae]|uniref:DUF1534 domain-containing protein n=1 Tax=Pseudomonas glycinae TaxID=1785145 RepID=A0ABM6QI06_9PSED|nr:hypothetical protein AWU82_29655 [Pseudomonas glycinae]